MPFLDSFDTLNTAFWSLTGNSPQVTPAVTGGALVIDVPPNAQPLPAQDYVSAGLYSRCRIGGNYDVQVDYRLLTWPDANGVNLNFSVGDRTIFRHNGSGGELISTYFPPLPGTNVLDYPLGGTLRFERKGALLTALYRDRLGSRVVLNRVGVDDGPVNVSLSVYTNRPTTGAADVKVTFDNFRVTRGEIDCP